MKSYADLARHEGNRELFDVVEMAIVSSIWEIPLHLHAEGLRGTGKTTIMRSAKQIMPPITRIKGCLYNCDPAKPHCPQHKDLTAPEIAEIGTEVVPRPFLEISHSAKLGTVVGSIDLAKITDPTNPTAALLPGIIPQAHRGVIFIDEINRLADTSPEITDVLLDLMGTKPGRVQIEETGLPVVEIPVQVSVWAASNPDEEPGPLQEIRRQLSDRFDLVIDMKRSRDPEAIADILSQSEAKKFNQQDIYNSASNQAVRMAKELEATANRYYNLKMPDYLRSYIARTYVKYNLESFRAIEAIQHAALLNCAIKHNNQVAIGHILNIMPMALQHRVDEATLARILAGDNKIVKDTTAYQAAVEMATADNEVETIQWEAEDLPLEQPLTHKNESLWNRIFSNKPNKENAKAEEPLEATPNKRARSLSELGPDNLVNDDTKLN